MRVIVKQFVERRLAGKTEVLGENLPQCHFVHHKKFSVTYIWLFLTVLPILIPLFLFSSFTFFLPSYFSFDFLLFYLRGSFVTFLRFTVRQIKCCNREDLVDLFQTLSQPSAGGTEKTAIISVVQLFS
jgi:hypothetical protein